MKILLKAVFNLSFHFDWRRRYNTHYGVELGKKAEAADETKKSRSVEAKLKKRNKTRKLDENLEELFMQARTCTRTRSGCQPLACISCICVHDLIVLKCMCLRLLTVFCVNGCVSAWRSAGASVRVPVVAAGAVRPSGRLHPRGSRARVLSEEDGQEARQGRERPVSMHHSAGVKKSGKGTCGQ